MQLLLSFLSGTLLFSLYNYFPSSCIALFISTAVFLVTRKRGLLLIFVGLGIFYAFLRYPPATETPDIWGKELKVTGSFIQDGNSKLAGSDIETYVIERARDAKSGENLDELHDREIGLPADFSIDYDEQYELLLETGKDRRRLNPGQPGSGRLYGRIISADDTGRSDVPLFAIFDRQRGLLNRYIAGRFSGDSAAFVSALTTGDTAGLSDEERGAFNATGLAHILSISGTHFGMFSVLLFGLFGFFIKRLPYRILQRLTIYLSPAQAAALLSIPFMIMYLGISGGSIPAVRSFIMINLFLFGLLIDRKGLWLNSLLFAAVVLVAWDPEVTADLSFQLSFIAILFIGFALEKKDTVDEAPSAEDKRDRFVRYIKNALALSAAASLGTAPIAAYYFHYVSLVSPLSNLVVVPLVGFVLIPLSLISSFAYIFSGHYIFAPLVSAVSDLTVALVGIFAGLPFAEFKVPTFPPVLCILFYIGFLLYLALGSNKKMLILPFLPFCVYAIMVVSEKKELSVTFVDVGQGDSAVIELPDRKTIVVDTGRTGKETAAFLNLLGKRNIDALVLTHGHPDHTGGVEYLMKKFRVREIWDNGRITYPPELHMDARHRKLERGDLIEGPGYRLAVLHPYREFYTMSEDSYSEENSSSLVLGVTGEKKTFLLAGDIEEEAEEDISHLKTRLTSDVIKIPHHGSRTSAEDEFLGEVAPSIAVVSVGRDNSFGHPSQEVLKKLEGKRILRTDLVGAVKISENGEDLLIKTCREFTFQRADDSASEKRNIVKLFSVW